MADKTDKKTEKKSVKTKKEQRLKRQVDNLKRQAQVDLEGYVTCRSALRATRIEHKEAEHNLDRLRSEYDEMKERHASHKLLRYKRRRVWRAKRNVKELARAKKRYRTRMREHRDGVRRKMVTNICACLSTLAMVAMMVWRVNQLGLGVYYLALYVGGESIQAVMVAVMRQLLRVGCIVYGLNVVWQSIQIWSMRSSDWTGVLRINVKYKAYWLTILGIILQILSHGDMLTNLMMLITIISQMVMAVLLSTESSIRRNIKVGAILYVSVLCALAAYGVFFCRKYEIPTQKWGTSTFPVSNHSYISQMWEMSTESEFYNMGMYGLKKNDGYGMMTIPGLAYAKTINCETMAVDCCTSMTPQGIAVTDKYTYISAYCSTKKHRSVIFMLDTETGDYVKTIVLKDTTHAGGLAYDTKNDVLWVSSYLSISDEDNKRTRHASISCFTLNAMEAYDFGVTKRSLMYKSTCAVMFPATSFITYYDGHIYAGYRKKDKNSYSMASSYEIINGGTEIADEADDAFYIPGRVQGLQVYRNEIIFSISYGVDESRIEVYDTMSGELSSVNYSNAKPRQELKLPQKLEQIYSFNGRLYCLFESGSFAYRLTAPVCMDRVVSLDETSLVGLR